MSRAYYCTVEELNERGRENIPGQFKSNMHLIYSSPATLAFNSPGAEGFGVKRAGLAVPGSIMPVSYTHLDVYKRQVQVRSTQKNFAR